MINFTIICENDHEFSSYFSNSNSCDELLKKHMVDCPECGSIKCRRGLSAPMIPQKSTAKTDAATRYRNAVRQIEENTDDVGTGFTDEAIAMHDGEIPERPIRGKISADDAERMDDAGVEYLPYTKPNDPKDNN